MKYGERLRKARKLRKLSQPQLAELSGVGQGSISKIERGDQEASTFDVPLAIALRIRPEWLTTGEGDMEGPDISDDIASLARRLTPGEWTYIKEQAEQLIARRMMPPVASPAAVINLPALENKGSGGTLNATPANVLYETAAINEKDEADRTDAEYQAQKKWKKDRRKKPVKKPRDESVPIGELENEE